MGLLTADGETEWSSPWTWSRACDLGILVIINTCVLRVTYHLLNVKVMERMCGCWAVVQRKAWRITGSRLFHG